MLINEAIHILRNPYGHSSEAVKEAQLYICDAYEEESKAHQANRKVAEQHGIDTTIYFPAAPTDSASPSDALQGEMIAATKDVSAAPQEAPQQEPVAWMWQNEETGNIGFVDAWQLENGFEKANPRLKVIKALYAAPVSPISTPKTADQLK